MDWKCRRCGHIFDEGEAGKAVERHNEVMGGFTEVFRICPSCGSDEIEEAVECRLCLGSFLADELVGGYYCKECMENFMREPWLEQFARENIYEFAEFIYEKEKCECSKRKDS